LIACLTTLWQAAARMKTFFSATVLLLAGTATALLASPALHCKVVARSTRRRTPTASPPPPKLLATNRNDDYTAKQRMREEIDSPFRKVRVVLFGFSTASALVALYFSLLTLGKVLAGFPETPSTGTALTDVGINVAAVAGFAFLTYRDVRAGEANLQRIARGGQLASLRVAPADGSSQVALGSYRNKSRLLIAAGGAEFLQELATSASTVAEPLKKVNVILVPLLLLREDDSIAVDVDAGRALWREASPETTDAFVNFPVLAAPWLEYLLPEIQTATSQGFDPVTKGLGIYVKKNGRILRRATGQPNWDQFIGTMEVMDGSQFGKPPSTF